MSGEYKAKRHTEIRIPRRCEYGGIVDSGCVADIARQVTGKYCAHHEDPAHRFIAISEAEAANLRKLLEVAREYRKVSCEEHPGGQWFPAHEALLTAVAQFDPADRKSFPWE